MKAVFADTFDWIAITNKLDTSHKQALEMPRALRLPLKVTTEQVITEYLNFFALAGGLDVEIVAIHATSIRLRGWEALPLLESEGDYEHIRRKLTDTLEAHRSAGLISAGAYRQARGQADASFD